MLIKMNTPYIYIYIYTSTHITSIYVLTHRLKNCNTFLLMGFRMQAAYRAIGSYESVIRLTLGE